MSDRLREALERAFPIFRMGGLTDALYPADEGEGEGWALDNDDWEVVNAAARRFLALTETGQVDYCETHGCTDIADESHRGGDFVEEHCVHGEWIVGESPSLDTWNCHIVPVHLIPADYLTEEE